MFLSFISSRLILLQGSCCHSNILTVLIQAAAKPMACAPISGRVHFVGIFGDMGTRESRRKTFDSEIFDEYWSEKCVKAGFFSLGEDDEIQCFACGCKFKSWLKHGHELS